MRSIKWFLAIAAFFLCAGVASAQWPFIPIQQSESGGLNGHLGTCAFDQNVTSGNYILVGIGWESSTNTPAVTDTLGSSYTQKLLNTSNTQKVAVYTTTLGSSGANTVNVAVSGGSFININCVELPPLWTLTLDGTPAVASYAGTPATVTTPALGGGGTTLNSDLIYAFASNNNTFGWQAIQNGSLGTWYQVGSVGASGGPVDSSAGFITIGGAAGGGTTVTLDNGGSTGTLLTIAFQSKPLAITSAAVAPDGAKSATYDFTLLAAGGAGAYTWSVVAGALPTGLSLNASTGEITGTPTVSNNYSATFQVTDGTHTATKAISFKISTGFPGISFVQGISVTTPSAGGAFSFTFPGSVTAGNAIVASMNFNAVRSQISYCTDTLGTPFQLIAAWPAKVNPANGQTSTIFSELIVAGTAPSSGSDTVTCGSESAPTSLGFLVAMGEFSGVSYFANDNTTATRGNNASPVTITSSTLTTLVPNELIFGSCFGNTGGSTNTVNAPFSVVGTNTVNPSTGYRIVTTVAGYTMSCDQANNNNTYWLIGLAGLRPSGGPVSPPGGRGPKGKIL
jgi:hypothetical protein